MELSPSPARRQPYIPLSLHSTLRRWWQVLTVTAPGLSIGQSLRATLLQSLFAVLGALGMMLLIICIGFEEHEYTLMLCIALPLLMCGWWLERHRYRAGAWLFTVINVLGVLTAYPPGALITNGINAPLLFALPAISAAVFLRPRAAFGVMIAFYSVVVIQLWLAQVSPQSIVTFVAFACIDTSVIVAPALILLAYLERALQREAEANETLRAWNASLDAQVVARTHEVEQANHALKISNTALHEANARQAQWLHARQIQTTNVAHDQKGELAGLLVAVDDLDAIFADHNVALPICAVYADQVRASVDALDRLVSALMVAAQLECRTLLLKCVAFDARPLLMAVVQRMQVICQREGVVLEADDCQAPLLMLADGEQVERMVANLIDNARKYRRRETASLSDGTCRIWVRAQLHAKTISITVEDNGIGIADVARVRQRWVREPSAVAGTGLGLSLCSALARQMGGRLDLVSTLGQGTRATIVLPRAATGQCSQEANPVQGTYDLA